MTESFCKTAARAAFRWYLNRFPLRDGKVRLYEALHRSLLPPERQVLAHIEPGFVLNCDLQDPEQCKIYFFGHYHERYEARLIRTILRRGDHFWDIGANIGYYTLLAAAVLADTGGVVAFEPGRAAFQGLSENLRLNTFATITALNLAVAERSGEARLFLGSDLPDTGASLYPGGTGREQVEVVQTVSLDDVRHEEGLVPPQVIKIDVEGAELAVLRGAGALLADVSPLLLVEMETKTLEAAGTDKAAIQEVLSPLGYRGAFLHKGRWFLAADMGQTRGRNIFWFNPDCSWHRERVAPLGIEAA